MPTPEARAERERQAREAAIDEVSHRERRSRVSVTVLFVAFGLFVAFALWQFQARADSDRRTTVELQRTTELLSAIVDRLDQAQQALEAETAARTSANCTLQVSYREDLRRGFNDLYDAIENAYRAAGTQAPAFVAERRAALEQRFPPLRCDAAGTAVVIAVPAGG